jgi:LysM repeat protein
MGSVRRANWKQYAIYLGLNVLVSALTILVVLSIWDRREASNALSPTPTIDVIAQVASAVPTTTPTVPPSPTPMTYIVQYADTLSGIADELDIPVEALMAANGITDPNTIDLGQVLIIPALDSPVYSTLTALPLITPKPTLTPVPDAPPARIVIYGVEGAAVLVEEYVRLLNSGGEVSMAGWTLDDGEGREYIFPAFTFYTTGAVHVHTRAGEDTSIDLYWGLDEAVWSPGKIITLRDDSGIVQSTFKIPDN